MSTCNAILLLLDLVSTSKETTEIIGETGMNITEDYWSLACFMYSIQK